MQREELEIGLPHTRRGRRGVLRRHHWPREPVHAVQLLPRGQRLHHGLLPHPLRRVECEGGRRQLHLTHGLRVALTVAQRRGRALLLENTGVW